jgi:sec-independent protein translocase protein TatC
LIRCLGVFIVLATGLFFIADPVLSWLARPVGEFIFTAPTEAFLVRFKIAAGVAVVAGFPYFLFEAWRFVEFALKSQERKLIFLAIPTSAVLFYVGMTVAVFVVAPTAMKFLMSFSTPDLRPMISVQSYLSFLFWMVMGFGILFQLPLVLVTLSAAGLVTSAQLASFRRVAIVLILIVAALLTPGPDIVSQLILALPTYLLYEAALLISKAMELRRKPVNSENS